MQIVIDHRGNQRELDLEIEHPHACVADLVSAVDPELAGTGAGVVVEGRLFGPDMGLDEIGLYEGAVVTIGHRAPQAADAPDGPALAIVGGPAAGTLHHLDGGSVLIGRDQGCDVVLADPTVSTRHARLDREGDALVVSDLGSHNGTWVEGLAVTGPTPVSSTPRPASCVSRRPPWAGRPTPSRPRWTARPPSARAEVTTVGMPGRRRAMMAAAMVLALVALTACGGDGKDEASKPVEPPTTQPRDLEAEVLAAYRAGWDAFSLAGDPPNPEHPVLTENNTGPALAAAQQGLAGYRERGLVSRGNAELNPRVVSVTPDRAEVEDCVLDHGKLIDAATGRVVQEPSGVRKRWEAVLVVADGRWKTQDMRLEGPC